MANKVKSNELRHYVTIQEAVQTTDLFGQVSYEWANIVTSLPAKMEAKNASERNKGDKLDNPMLFTFTVRYNANIKPSQRVLYNGNYYAIYSVFDKEGLRKHLELTGELTDSGSVTI